MSEKDEVRINIPDDFLYKQGQRDSKFAAVDLETGTIEKMNSKDSKATVKLTDTGKETIPLKLEWLIKTGEFFIFLIKGFFD